MKDRKYMEVTVFVSDESCEKNVCFQNETLDGKRGMLKLFIRADKKGETEKVLGYFNVKDLIAGIKAAANADIPYLSEQMEERDYPRGEKRGYEKLEGKSEF